MSKTFIPVFGVGGVVGFVGALGLIGTAMVVSSLTAGAVLASSSSANATPAAAADSAPASASDSLTFMMIPPQGDRVDAFLTAACAGTFFPSVAYKRRYSAILT